MLMFLTVVSILAIIYGILSFIVPKLLEDEDVSFSFPMGKTVLIIGVIVFCLTCFITKVGPQEVGVLYGPKGVVEKPLTTGWHIIYPWQSIEFMDKTVWVYTLSNRGNEGQKKGDDAVWSPTKEGIKMGLDLSISWRIDPVFAPWIYQNISEADGGSSGRYLWVEQNIIRAKTKSSLALTVSEYTPIEVYSNKRQEIQNIVSEKLQKELAAYHLILEQVDIREVFYNPDYEKVIVNKKLAEQEAMRLIEVTKQKQELLTQANIEKDIAIKKAMGESEALKIKGQSVTNNPKIIQLELINKWDGKLPTYMMGNSQGIILSLTNKE